MNRPSPFSFFRVRTQYPDPVRAQQARALRAMSLGILVVLIALMIFQFAQSVAPTGVLYVVNVPILIDNGFYLPLYIFQIASLVLVVIGIDRGSFTGARALFVFSASAFAVITYIANGLTSFYLILMVVPTLSMALLYDLRAMLVSVFLTAFTLIMLVLFDTLQIIQVETILSRRPYEMLLVSIPLIGLLGLFSNSISASQRSLLSRSAIVSGELATLARLGRTLGKAQDAEGILVQAVEIVHDDLGFYHVQAFLVEPLTRVLTLTASTGMRFDGSPLRRRIPPDEPNVFNAVLQSGRMRLITLRAAQSDRTEFLPATRAQIIVPVLIGEEVVGLLDAQTLRLNAPSDRDMDALAAVAAQIALALESARASSVVEALAQERDDLTAQAKTMRVEMNRLSQEASGRVWSTYLESRANRQVSYEWRGGAIAPGGNPPPLPSGSNLTPALQTIGDEQVLSIPILSRGQPLGIMEFRAAGGQLWDERSLELARAISQRLALALDSLRLVERAQLAVSREQVANQIAAILQSKLDVDSLMDTAVESFQQALGATRTSVRLGVLDTPEKLDGPDRKTSAGLPEGAAS